MLVNSNVEGSWLMGLLGFGKGLLPCEGQVYHAPALRSSPKLWHALCSGLLLFILFDRLVFTNKILESVSILVGKDDIGII